MAAAQSGKKKSQPQKKVKQLPGGKAPCKTTQPKEKKVDAKQSKQEQETPIGRPGNKRKETGHASGLPAPKKSHVGRQSKARLPVKGSGKAASSRRGAGRQGSPKAKGAKVGRNLCFFSSRDLQYEVNELMRKELTAHMFANNPRGHH